MAFDKAIRRFDPSRTRGTRTHNALRGDYWTRDRQGRYSRLTGFCAPIPYSQHDAETLDLDAIFTESTARCLMRIAEHTQRRRDMMAEEGPYVRARDLRLEEIRK